MPKQVLNINNFSGGINKSKNPRDLELQESVTSTDLMSYNEGVLTSKGALARPDSIALQSGGYGNDYIKEGIKNFYYVNPEIGFRKFHYIKNTNASSKIYTGNPDGTYHGFEVGTRLLILRGESGNSGGATPQQGKIILVEAVSEDGTTFTGDVGFNDNDIFLAATDATYNANSKLLCDPLGGHLNNRYVFIATEYGKFGFFKLGENKTWFGGVNPVHMTGAGATGNTSDGVNGWYFDTEYLWNFWQHSGFSLEEKDISKTKVFDAFYENGVFRTLVDAPKSWHYGYCKRPVGLYAIPTDRVLFDSTTGAYINTGWYSLTTHCLSPQEYHNYSGGATWTNSMTLSSQNFNYKGAGRVIYNNSTTISAFNSAIAHNPGDNYATNLPSQFSIAVGHAANAASGDWQFKSGSEHASIGLGVSLLYDNVDPTLAQESLISQLTLADDSINISMTGDSAENDKALYLYVKVSRGQNLSANSNLIREHELASNTSFTGQVSTAERRGGEQNSWRTHNLRSLNPRNVGANIWLTHNADGPLDDPLLLATLNYYSDDDNYGSSVSHDSIKPESNWASTGDNSYYSILFKGIPSVPVLTYKLKNGYKHNENIHAWYKTYAIVNRRLYAGNVSYFGTRSPGNTDEPLHFPDRILRSPVNKFDILPESSYLDIISQDGQDIVKLSSLNQKLLVFKHDDLFVIDASGEFEYLEATHKGVGIINPNAVCETPNAIYWVNSQGIYGYNGQEQPQNLIRDKIPSSEFLSEIWTNSSHLEYEPQDNMLFLFTHWQGEGDALVGDENASGLITINLNTGAIFYKNRPCEDMMHFYSSGGIIDNKLYISGCQNSNGETFSHQTKTAQVQGVNAQGVFIFTINNTSHPQQLGGTNNKYLLINKGGSWANVNSVAFTETAYTAEGGLTQVEVASNAFVNEFLTKTNGAGSNLSDEFEFSIAVQEGGSSGGEYFYAVQIKAKNPGTAYNLAAVSNPDSVTEYGNTFAAFAETTSDSEINTIGDINDFGIGIIQAGTNATYPAWYISADREGNRQAGISYTFQILYGDNDGLDAEERKIITANYNTSTDPGSHYYGYNNPETSVAATTTTYTSDCTANDGNNNVNLVKNLREFLLSNYAKDQYGNNFDIGEHFTFGSYAAGDSTVEDNYFDITLKDSSNLIDYSDLSVSCTTSDGTGSGIYTWNPSKETNDNKPKFETKDFDFEQPNVRKKIYKVYITYKLISTIGSNNQIYVQYANDLGNSFSAATVTSTSNAYLPTSTPWRREEIKFGSGTNNVYSIRLRFKTDTPIDLFEINDITFIYRTKNAK